MNCFLHRVNLLTMNRTIVLLLVALLSQTMSFSQNQLGRGAVVFGSAGLAEDTLYLNVEQDIAVQLLPFDELVKVATMHSPYMKYQHEIANGLSQAQQVTRMQVLQNVSGFVNYSTGTQSILSSGANVISPTGQDVLGQIANGYRIGVDVRLPLYELFGRKHQVQQARSNYKAALVQKEIIEQQLKQNLINVYQDMITAQQLLKIYLLDEQTSLTSLRLAEVELQKGRITADAMASITNRYVQAKVGAEQGKGNFLKSVHYFEVLMGTSIQQLKRN